MDKTFIDELAKLPKMPKLKTDKTSEQEGDWHDFELLGHQKDQIGTAIQEVFYPDSTLPSEKPKGQEYKPGLIIDIVRESNRQTLIKRELRTMKWAQAQLRRIRDE